MKRFRLPDTLVIILGFMLLFTLLTWLIPGGAFERQELNGREVLVPGSYQPIPSDPQGPGDFLMAPIKGFTSAAEIIAFVFLVGGAFGLLNATGAITAGLQALVRWSSRSKAARRLLVPVLVTFFSLAGATFGMSEETLVFVLITIPLAQALGYDVLLGVSIPFIGAGAGFASAFSNPFTIGIAQGIAELPPFSGWGYRLLIWVIFTLAAILFLSYHMRRIDRKQVQPYNPKQTTAHTTTEQLPFTKIHLLILLLFVGSLALLIVGVSKWGWYIQEIAALFVGLGLLAALFARLPMAEAKEAFTQGARDMMTAGLVIGLSKGLLIIAQDGRILDTILFSVSDLASGLPKVASVEVMFAVQSALNFFIPSGSGQAALSMPIMAPLSDLLDISRQTAVLAFQFGDGISNLIIPTSGVTMGVLAIGGIPYDKWVKWAGPFVLLLFLLAALLLLPPVLLFFYGPF